MKAILCVLSILTLVYCQSNVCSTLNCGNVQTLTGLQTCVNSAKSCTPSQATPFCATCALITETTGADFNLANPLVAQCIYELARTCQKNLDVGADAFVCSGSSPSTSSACAQAFVTYSSIDDLVASALYPQCLAVANANCLGYTSHSWCSVGGTSLAGRDIVSFLQNLQSACNFPLRAKRGTFVFKPSTVDGATVNDLLLGDLRTLTGTTVSQNLFAADNSSTQGQTVTANIDIISGVENKSPNSVANLLTALFNDPTSDIHKGNATKHLASLSFADNYPFTANSGDNLTNGQKAGIVAGVLIFVVLVLVVYQLYAYYSKRTGEESDSDEDDEDSAVIHQRNQARYAAANKQDPAPGQIQSTQPVQSQDEAIVAWS